MYFLTILFYWPYTIHFNIEYLQFLFANRILSRNPYAPINQLIWTYPKRLSDLLHNKLNILEMSYQHHTDYMFCGSTVWNADVKMTTHCQILYLRQFVFVYLFQFNAETSFGDLFIIRGSVDVFLHTHTAYSLKLHKHNFDTIFVTYLLSDRIPVAAYIKTIS